MFTTSCCYPKSFSVDIHFQVLFEPLTFPCDQKWFQGKSLSHLLWCWAVLCGAIVSVKPCCLRGCLLLEPMDCVLPECRPAFAPLVLSLLIDFVKVLDSQSSLLLFGLCGPLGTLNTRSRCSRSSLIFCHSFSWALSPVSPVHSICSFNLAHPSACSFAPPLTNSKRIQDTRFLSCPRLLCLFHKRVFSQETLLIRQKRTVFWARLPRKWPPWENTLCLEYVSGFKNGN